MKKNHISRKELENFNKAFTYQITRFMNFIFNWAFILALFNCFKIVFIACKKLKFVENINLKLKFVKNHKLDLIISYQYLTNLHILRKQMACKFYPLGHSNNVPKLLALYRVGLKEWPPYSVKIRVVFNFSCTF